MKISLHLHLREQNKSWRKIQRTIIFFNWSESNQSRLGDNNLLIDKNLNGIKSISTEQRSELDKDFMNLGIAHPILLLRLENKNKNKGNNLNSAFLIYYLSACVL